MGCPLFVADHGTTLADALEPRRTSVALVIRDPAERFVSAFNSRMRAGRPTYDKRWIADEAVAFLWFRNPNSLAEALGSDDERLQSAARFAMQSILHLRCDYAFYLHSPEFLDANAHRLFFVCDLASLSNRAPELFAPFGVSKERVLEHFAPAHQSTRPPTPLSPLALTNLKHYWEREWVIYEHCRKFIKPKIRADTPACCSGRSGSRLNVP